MSDFNDVLDAKFPVHSVTSRYAAAVAADPKAAERISAWAVRAKDYVLRHAFDEYILAGGEPEKWDERKEGYWEQILARAVVDGDTTQAAVRSLKSYNGHYHCPDI